MVLKGKKLHIILLALLVVAAVVAVAIWASFGHPEQGPSSSGSSSQEGSLSERSESSALESEVSEEEPSSAVSSSSQSSQSQASSSSHASSSASKAPTPPPSPSTSVSLKLPSAPGTAVISDDSGVAFIDYSNASQGYVMACYTGGGDKRVKVQVIKGGVTYSYNLNRNGTWETLPLQMGNGTYTLRVARQVSGNGYGIIATGDVSVSLASALSPYLVPNQRVYYTAGSSVVAKSNALCSGKSELEKIRAVYLYAAQNITYDSALASNPPSGYIPDPDRTLSSGKGICYDYAALVAAMLRVQGIATKLVMGNEVSSGGAYHAWNQIYVSGGGTITIGISFSGGSWNVIDATFAATNGDAENFAINPGNYPASLVY